MENIAIELHNLTVTYQNRPAVWNLDYTIPMGKLAAIIGPNGSGKTTSLKAIMGLLKPSSGYVKIFGKSLDEVREKVAYVPQRGSVDWDFPINVLETVMMGRTNRRTIFKWTTKKDKELAFQALERVQLADFAHRQISQLSGGQQQRVFIARALVQDADLYLLDEPFAAVDITTEQAIITLLKEMKNQGKTVVVVHHDLQSVPEYFDYLVMINTRLVAVGETEKVFTPEFLQQTYGSKLNLLTQLGELMHEKGFGVREKK